MVVSIYLSAPSPMGASKTELFDTLYSIHSGHCKKLAPEYAAAAQELAKRDPPLSIAKVDATENKELGERFGIKGFPTLKFFK